MSINQRPHAANASSGDVGSPDPRQLRAILIAVSIALMAVIASVSGLNVAQTHMAVEFGASQTTVLWIINIYTLALAALLLPLGAIGDRLGRKPMLITGLVADWRWLFVLPVVLVALAMTLKSVPNSRERSAHSFDTIGALVSAIAVIGLIFVLQEGPERGWTAPITLISLTVGVVAAVAFVAWELHRRDASLLDVRLFRQRGLASGSITLLVVFGPGFRRSRADLDTGSGGVAGHGVVGVAKA